MAAPDIEMRSYIGYASSQLQFGHGIARVLDLMGFNFPHADQARLGHAVELAVQYRRTAERVREVERLMKTPGQKPAAQSLASFFRPSEQPGAQVSVRMYFSGHLTNGREVRGSFVVNVDSTTTLGTLRARFGAAVCGGYFQGPNQTYQCRDLELSVQAISPYARGTGIALDTAPITRAHPNPYLLNRNP